MRRRFLYVFLIFIFTSFICSAKLKSPNEFFGVRVGSDRTLVEYSKLIEYYRYLSKVSPMVKLSLEGYSTLNNPMYVIFVSSPENIKDIPKLIEINKKLANPDLISKSSAKKLIRIGKPFLLVTCAIHATEIGSTQMLPIFIYKLLTSGKKELLKNIVLVFVPSANPDGNIMITRWYKKWLGTPYEGAPYPFLYHYYAGHDNNRDFFMLNLKETKVINSILHKKYFPQVFLDMHQMGYLGPRMFVPPFKDPMNQNLSPIMLREASFLGEYMALKLQENGKSGVATSYAFDAYWPGGSKNTAWYKNVVGLLTELASVKIATPIYIDYNELRGGSKGLAEYKRQVNFPSPWKGGWWRLKDIIDYEIIALNALVEAVSKNHEMFLKNFYKMGLSSIKAGVKEKPHGYLIPLRIQHDKVEAYRFISKMIENGVRVYRIKKDFCKGYKCYKKDDFYIPMAQPYRAFIKTMMERQKYPEIKVSPEGPIIEPYDQTGWTMPLMMGVKYEEASKIPEKELLKVEYVVFPEVEIVGSGDYYFISPNSNETYKLINKLIEYGIEVERIVDKKSKYLGWFVFRSSFLNEDKLKKMAYGKTLKIYKSNLLNTKTIKLKKEKLCIYQPYIPSMDEGWTRWILDYYGFKYKILHNEDFKKKKLLCDTLIISSIKRETIVNGVSRWYKGLPPNYKGGIGKRGISLLKDFLKTGGKLILLGRSSEVAIKDLGLPLKETLSGSNKDSFYCPGSILKIFLKKDDPIAWGMEGESILYFTGYGAFKTSLPQTNFIKRVVIARFPEESPILLSGYLKGEEFLRRRVPIVRFRYFKGNVFVFGGAIQRRAQTSATFKFLFNSILFNSNVKYN